MAVCYIGACQRATCQSGVCWLVLKYSEFDQAGSFEQTGEESFIDTAHERAGIGFGVTKA